ASRRKSRNDWRGGRNFGSARRRTKRRREGRQLGEDAMGKIALVAASAAMVVSAACSTLGKAGFEQPVVNLKDVKIRGLGLTGGNLDVQLSIYNPNQYRLDATR